jgi:hypothetical protein
VNGLQALLVSQITIDGIIGLDCFRSNAGLIDLQNSMLEVDGRRESLKYAGKLGCFRVVAHDKVVMPAQSEMIIRGTLERQMTLQYYPVYYSDLLSLRS